MNTQFSSLPLSPAMLANLERLEYSVMTPIQAASLGPALAGKDLIAQAKTGSGKTAAFAIALLSKIDRALMNVQAMVMCPTRELADQVTQEVRRLARAEENIKVLTLTGGVVMRGQRDSLEHGAHIIVGTPGRLMDLIDRGNLNLESLRIVVLDEADRMLDMGFQDSIAHVLKNAPSQRQTLLFSATYPEGIAKLSARYQKNPQRISVDVQHNEAQIEQRFYEIVEGERLTAVIKLLNHFRPESTLAFCNTKHQVKELTELLQVSGVSALALHGELEQRDRDQVLIQFSQRSCSVMIATDVAARGLDIEQIDLVINVDVTQDAQQHVHRVGRTGRAGKKGFALSLVSPQEMGYLSKVEDLQGEAAKWFKLRDCQPKSDEPLQAPMITLQLQVERKEKIRAGDVLGALTGPGGIPGTAVGKINIGEFSTYVAVSRELGRDAAKHLSSTKIKGKTVRIRRL